MPRVSGSLRRSLISTARPRFTIRAGIGLPAICAWMAPAPQDASSTTMTSRIGVRTKPSTAESVASVGHDPDGHVHTERIALRRIRFEVFLVVAFPLPAVRHVRVHADEHQQPVVVAE